MMAPEPEEKIAGKPSMLTLSDLRAELQSEGWAWALPLLDSIPSQVSEAVRAEREWQPIATAPKEGSILAAYTYGRRWVIEVVEWDKEYRVWIGFGLSGDEESRELSPTHWMPLPAPPAAAIRARGDTK